MAIALNPLSGNRDGIIRCITSREGDVEVAGYTDRSVLHKITGSREHFDIGERIVIRNEEEILAKIGGKELDYLGLEDPDLWLDPDTGLLHMYCTIPFISRDKKKQHSLIHLGHAAGKTLDSLEMTMPALQADAKNTAKEASIAPINSKGIRYNLIESSSVEDKVWYSTVRVAIAQDMGTPWRFGPTAFHPAEHKIPWIGGHASPGPLFSKQFIDVGEGKVLGLINGREANRHEACKTVYGMFSVGLFIYDYENGKIDWVSPEPFIQDIEARTITFASQFVETKPGEGILYAHVDDSFVRAYTLYADGIRQLLP